MAAFDGITWHEPLTIKESVENNYIAALAEDNNGAIWIGYGREANGITCYDGVSWKTFVSDDGMKTRGVYSICVDYNNIVWIGGSGYATSYYNDIFTYHNIFNYNLTTGWCTDIFVDSNNVKWFVSRTGNFFSYGTTWNWSQIIDVGRISSIDSRNIKWFGTSNGLSLLIDTPVSVECKNKEPLPLSIFLKSYPNPFNHTTAIVFTLPESDFASMVIYNIMGQKVRELFSTHLSAGKHTVLWDGKGDDGIPVSSGMYISRLKSGGYAASNMMHLIK